MLTIKIRNVPANSTISWRRYGGFHDGYWRLNDLQEENRQEERIKGRRKLDELKQEIL